MHACAKHFAGNELERLRMWFDARIETRALHELYLKPFEMLVKEGKVASIMTGYNKLGGSYCCSSEALLHRKAAGMSTHLERKRAASRSICCMHSQGSAPIALGAKGCLCLRHPSRVTRCSQNIGRSVAPNAVHAGSRGCLQSGPLCVMGQLHSPVTRLQVPLHAAQLS